LTDNTYTGSSYSRSSYTNSAYSGGASYSSGNTPTSVPVKPAAGKNELAVSCFISEKLAGADGSIATNLNSSDGSSDTLSESVGLLMNYYVLTGSKELFDREAAFLKNKMLADNNLVKWKVGKTEASCNAAIDDLRIAGVLFDAFELWGEEEYYNLAGFIQDAVYSLQVEDYQLYELCDWSSGKCRQTIPLCYLDLHAMDRAGSFNPGWLKVVDRSVSIIRNGRLGDKSPFYYKTYDYNTGKYSLDEEYEKGRGICLTYTLLTGLHLAQSNEDTTALTGWLRSETEKGRVYAWYDPYTMKPAGNVESTAVYALAAIYAHNVGEQELSSKLAEKLDRFQVKEKSSPYYGGFGSPQDTSFYSFDNLTALLAMQLNEK
jgi:hypothetical protein